MMTRAWTLFTLSTVFFGCSAPSRPLRATLAASKALPSSDRPLTRSHFLRDRGSLSEEALQRILAAPVFLEEKARVGVLPVATAYAPDPGIPVAEVAGALSQAMESTGLFDVSTEVSTDWPTDSGTAGLRELAARYRAEYLLLYRHRFVDRSHTNAWGWAYLTVIGALFVPAATVEVAGVLEATLFDVKSGTLLFTVHERVYSRSNQNIWNRTPKRRAIRTTLLTRATKKLGSQVVGKIQRLVAAREAYKRSLAKDKDKTKLKLSGALSDAS